MHVDAAGGLTRLPAVVEREVSATVRERRISLIAARELGTHRPTAYVWAWRAGISTSEPPPPGRSFCV